MKMREQLYAEVEPFAIYPGEGGRHALQGEVNRSSRDYIRWVQQSLNRILGLQLAVDGISGTQTRSAIRSFQKQRGLAVDGIVGKQTEAALITAGAGRPPGSSTQPVLPGPSTPVQSQATPLALVNSRMPKSGLGFTTSANDYKYGVPETIEALKAIAQEWHRRRPAIQFMVRDISRQGGGKFSTHASHRIGLDADVQLWVGSQKVCMNNPNYAKWRPYVQELVSVIRANPVLKVKTIGFTDRQVNNVSYWAGHTCHLHIRFCMPAKYQAHLDLSRVYKPGEKKPSYSC
jgi:hypothetical protein